jgi:VanZ family protein
MAFTPPDGDGQGHRDKVVHLFAFFTLLLLFDCAYPLVKIYCTKVFLLLIFGSMIETIQYFIPGREFSLLDILANSIGLIAYLTARPLCIFLIPRLDFSKKR